MASNTFKFSQRVFRRAFLTARPTISSTAAVAAAGALCGASIFFAHAEDSHSQPWRNQMRANQGAQADTFPAPKMEVPGVMPMHIVGHCANVELEQKGQKMPLEIAMYIDPMPTNVSSRSNEDMRVLLKPTEPYDRCLVLYTLQDTDSSGLTSQLSSHLQHFGLRKERLSKVFDPSIMPKTPPQEALNRLEQSLQDEARRQFNGKLPKHSQVVFVWRKEGFLDVRLNDKRASLILSPELSWALFDSFLGPQSMSPNARRDITTDLRNVSANA